MGKSFFYIFTFINICNLPLSGLSFLSKSKKLNSHPFTDASFEGIFKEYFGPLCNFVNSYIKDWESSREIVQSTFMKIWENKENIEVTSSVKSYLYQAVRNRMIDYIRANKRQDDLADVAGVDELEEKEELLDQQMIRREILRSLDKLKPKMKKIFSLAKIEGLTYGEVASYLNISKRSVEDNVAKALVLLREDLRENEYLQVG